MHYHPLFTVIISLIVYIMFLFSVNNNVKYSLLYLFILFMADNVIFCFAQCTSHHLSQVLETFGGSGPARALYYYRTGDILDDHTLKRLKNLATKAVGGKQL